MVCHERIGRNIVEVYRIVAAIAHQLGYIVAVIEWQATVDFVCRAVREMFFQYLVECFQTAAILQFFGTIVYLGVGKVAVDAVTEGRVTCEILVYGHRCRTCPDEDGVSLVVPFATVGFYDTAFHETRQQQADQKNGEEEQRKAYVWGIKSLGVHCDFGQKPHCSPLQER